jgi:hypothetical protein
VTLNELTEHLTLVLGCRALESTLPIGRAAASFLPSQGRRGADVAHRGDHPSHIHHGDQMKKIPASVRAKALREAAKVIRKHFDEKRLADAFQKLKTPESLSEFLLTLADVEEASEC